MSKGLGHIERKLLDLLQERPTDAMTLAARVYGLRADADNKIVLSDSQHAVVRRALNSLRRKGLVFGSERLYRDGRRLWSLSPLDDSALPQRELSSRTLARRANVSASTIQRAKRQLEKRD